MQVTIEARQVHSFAWLVMPLVTQYVLEPKQEITPPHKKAPNKKAMLKKNYTTVSATL